jgi:hypothetical protein
MRLTLHTAALEVKFRQLGRRGPVAVARAVNRTAASERTAMAREVAADMGITVKAARDAIAVKKASAANQVAQVVARGKRLPLIDFKARGPQPSRGRGRGVSYVMQGQRKTIGRAFIATVSKAGDEGQHAGHRGVFVRKMKAGRLPIAQLMGVSIAVAFEHLLPNGEARRADLLAKNVAHEIEFELSRVSATT